MWMKKHQKSFHMRLHHPQVSPFKMKWKSYGKPLFWYAYREVKHEICKKSIQAVAAYTVNPISVMENVTTYHPFDL